MITINQPADGPRLSAGERFRADRVARLNRIVEATGCRVVVSSTWRWNARVREGFSVSQLQHWLREAGFVGEVHDITTAFSDEVDAWDIEHHRGAEILAWCQAQPVAPRALAVLDDLALRGAVEPYLVRTDYRVGLVDADVERVIGLLRERPRRVPWRPAPRARRSASSPPASTPASPGR